MRSVRPMSEAASAPAVLVETVDGVTTLTINRPEVHNALSWSVLSELRTALASAKVDPATRVVVLTGAGDKAFCAGADLSGMAAGAGYAELHDGRGELARFFRDLWELGKPTVAKVRGWCLAGGFGVALACDIVVASDDARFGTPEVDRGLWPYMITVPMLRSMPPKVALELQLTGRRVGAEEAERIGFVNRVVPRGRPRRRRRRADRHAGGQVDGRGPARARRLLRGVGSGRGRRAPAAAPDAHRPHRARGRGRGHRRLRREARARAGRTARPGAAARPVVGVPRRGRGAKGPLDGRHDVVERDRGGRAVRRAQLGHDAVRRRRRPVAPRARARSARSASGARSTRRGSGRDRYCTHVS